MRALKPEQIAQVATLYAEGWSQAQLADRFNVARDTIQRALAMQGVKCRGHEEGRKAGRKSGWNAWRKERRAAAANPFHIQQPANHWRTQ